MEERRWAVVRGWVDFDLVVLAIYPCGITNVRSQISDFKFQINSISNLSFHVENKRRMNFRSQISDNFNPQFRAWGLLSLLGQLPVNGGVLPGIAPGLFYLHSDFLLFHLTGVDQ
jgi:hypothetical protein